MKKITIVSIVSFLFLCFSSISAYFMKYINIDNPWHYLEIGVIILIVSGVIALLFHKQTFINYICTFTNSIALGFCIRAWYIFRNYDNSIGVMLLISLLTVVYLWVFYFLSKIELFKEHFKIFFWTYLVLSFIAYLVVVFTTTTTFVSTFGFYMIIEIGFIFALCVENDDNKELINNLNISTYSVFVVAIIIAIAMLADGNIDGLDFDLDLDFSSPDKKKKKGM